MTTIANTVAAVEAAAASRGFALGRSSAFDGGGHLRVKTSGKWQPWDALRSIFNVRDYGAAADGITNDSSAFQAALDALDSAGGGILVVPPGIYLIQTDITSTSDNPIEIRGSEGATIIAEATISVAAAADHTDESLGSNLSRGDTSITLSDASSVEVGDIIRFYTNEVAETLRSRPKRHISVVTAVVSNTVTFAHPLNFDFATTDTDDAVKIRTGREVHISGLSFRVNTSAGSRCLRLTGVKHSTLERIRLVDPRMGSTIDRDGIFAQNSVFTRCRDIEARGLQYGINVQECGDFRVDGMVCHYGRHAVSPSYFAHNVYVNDLRGEGNFGIMDSHGAFEVHYSRVVTHSDTGGSNLRSCGGSVRDSYIRCVATSPDVGMQNIAFLDATYYDDRDFLVSRTTWINNSGMKCDFGRVCEYDHLTCRKLDGSLAGVGTKGTTGGPSELIINECTYQKGYGSSDRGTIKQDTRPNTFGIVHRGILPIVNAVNDGSHYVISPLPEGAISSRSGRCYGDVYNHAFTTSADPLTVPMKILTSPHPWSNQAGSEVYFVGILTLIAFCRHNNSGNSAVWKGDFHLVHKFIATESAAIHGPAYVDINNDATAPADGADYYRTQVSNDSLSVAISNVAHAAASASFDYGISFDVAISSGRTSPRVSLFYELTWNWTN